MGAILFILFCSHSCRLSRCQSCSSFALRVTKTEKQPLYILPAIGLVLLSLLPLTLFAGYQPVEQGYVGVVKRMGAVTGTLPAGPHFVTPFITTVDQVSTKTLQVTPSEDASSQDLQQVHTQVTLTYHFNSDPES